MVNFAHMKSLSNINTIMAFLRELEANNDRAWFKANKDRYDALRQPWEADVERLISMVSEFDPETRGLTVGQAVYRIYRDVRFSKNKAPYKNYFSAVVSGKGRHALNSCDYIHFQPGNLMIGGGIWCPDREILTQLRSLIDAEQEEFTKIITAEPFASRFRWESDSLKNVPRDYPKDHPMAQFLKMKEYLVTSRPDPSYFDCDDWVERVAADLELLQPLHQFLNYVFD